MRSGECADLLERCAYCEGLYWALSLPMVRRPHNCAGDSSRDYDWSRAHGHEYLDPQAPGFDANGAPV